MKLTIKLTFLDILTFQLLTFKIFNVITWSWFIVFLPFIIKWSSIIIMLIYAKYIISKSLNGITNELNKTSNTIFNNQFYIRRDE